MFGVNCKLLSFNCFNRSNAEKECYFIILACLHSVYTKLNGPRMIKKTNTYYGIPGILEKPCCRVKPADSISDSVCLFSSASTNCVLTSRIFSVHQVLNRANRWRHVQRSQSVVFFCAIFCSLTIFLRLPDIDCLTGCLNEHYFFSLAEKKIQVFLTCLQKMKFAGVSIQQ